MSKFKKGQSGNPSGRPKGSRNKATLLADQIFEEKLFGNDKKADAIISKAIALADRGFCNVNPWPGPEQYGRRSD